MPDLPAKSNSPRDRSDWTPARPEKIPEPTVWPAGLGLACTLLLWGLTSSLILTWVGLGLFIISLAGWIRDIRHERKES